MKYSEYLEKITKEEARIKELEQQIKEQDAIIKKKEEEEQTYREKEVELKKDQQQYYILKNNASFSYLSIIIFSAVTLPILGCLLTLKAFSVPWIVGASVIGCEIAFIWYDLKDKLRARKTLKQYDPNFLTRNEKEIKTMRTLKQNKEKEVQKLVEDKDCLTKEKQELIDHKKDFTDCYLSGCLDYVIKATDEIDIPMTEDHPKQMIK